MKFGKVENDLREKEMEVALSLSKQILIVCCFQSMRFSL